MLLLVVLLNFVLSFGQLIVANVYLSFLPYFTATGQLPPPTLDNYVNALFTTRSLQAVFNSLQLAAEVSVVTVVFALVLAFLAYKTRWRGRRLAEEIGTLPVAFPPLVLSTALLAMP